MNKLPAPNILETFLDIFPSETSIAVADKNKFVYYRPSQLINLQIKPGDEIRKGSATYKALLSKQRIFTYIDSNVFGISYFGLSVPVIKNEEIESVITAILPIRTDQSTPAIFTVKNNDRWFPISINDIIYLEAEHRKAKIVAKHISGLHKYHLSDIEQFLPADKFIRCHRSFIVNMNEIAEIQPDFHSTFLLVMKNGDRVPVSQSYASYFRKNLMF
ncbi:LytTR family DNA-binding domain-containing protein [Bacillus kwashiorkori]|uniref:LytTR family DNA-binding domain-containing protein n=1 Tax=Bacillus kwashiorkori TaxID=1522318 RepID=UPI0007857016|nr:LytTR family DNA-binding domain-containing protein [Bacillus kwashiorkori]